jgi:hypothetical protein
MKTCLIIILTLLIKLLISHKCGVDNMPHKAPVFIDAYDNDLRFLQDSTWSPIRIYVDYTQLDIDRESQMITAAYYDNIKSYTNKAIELYQKLLKVKRLTTNIRANYVEKECVDNYDPRIKTEGIDADVIVIPYITKSIDRNSFEASAKYCGLDSITYRPLMGTIEFSRNLDFRKKNAEKYFIMLIIHEINHILCFNRFLFQYFIDANGKRIPIENTITTGIVNGVTRTMIKSPKVLAAAKKFFNCGTLQGVELENQGGAGTYGFHWDARTMLSDYMIGITYGELYISDMTLALFEDPGWYTVNYYTGGLFRYGKNQGCDFLGTKCVNKGRLNSTTNLTLRKAQQLCALLEEQEKASHLYLNKRYQLSLNIITGEMLIKQVILVLLITAQ